MSAPSQSTPAAADSVVKCQACGAENEPSSKFCLTCGSALADPAEGQIPVAHNGQAEPDGSMAGVAHETLALMVATEINDVQERLLDRVATLDKQVADLQIDQVRAGRPWWQTPSILIALSALLLSLTTAGLSYLQARQRDSHDAHIELRGLIQQLSTLPQQNIELTQVYTNSYVIAQLGGLLQQENALLAKQARQVMAGIPNEVTSGEYILVANALAVSNLSEDAVAMYKQAEMVIGDYNDGVAVYRSEGQLLFYLGRKDEARQYYERASAIFDSFPTSSEYLKGLTNLQTEIFWAQSEYGANGCAEAREHIGKARQQFDALAKANPGARTNLVYVEQQLQQTESAVRTCLPR